MKKALQRRRNSEVVFSSALLRKSTKCAVILSEMKRFCYANSVQRLILYLTQCNECTVRGQFNKTFTLVIYKSDHCVYKRGRKRV